MTDKKASTMKKPIGYNLPKVEISINKTKLSEDLVQENSSVTETKPNQYVSPSESVVIQEVTKVMYQAERRRLPQERQAITHKFSINNQEGYLTVGLYEDGAPGEIFIRMAKTGSTMGGLLDSFALVTSLALQYGVPLDVLISKFSQQRFEPSGRTENKNIPTAESIVDYIGRWLAIRFLSLEAQSLMGFNTTQVVSDKQLTLAGTPRHERSN